MVYRIVKKYLIYILENALIKINLIIEFKTKTDLFCLGGNDDYLAIEPARQLSFLKFKTYHHFVVNQFEYLLYIYI